METEKSFRWSKILQEIVNSSSEKQRLATALGVTTVTLGRWADGKVNPQRSHLIKLVQVLQPQDRQDMVDALQEIYPDTPAWLRDETVEQIPSVFFAQVLSVRTNTTDSLRFWRISDMVLKKALELLDPNQLGMSVKIVQCMPPTARDKKIRSLRERTGKGNPPWTADLEHDVHFLGLESLSGYATEARHIVKDDNLAKAKSIPAVQAEFEISAAAHPIRFEGKIAGCLLISSTQEGYFSQKRLSLISILSDLAAIAFDSEDFYDPQLIELRVMPSLKRQHKIVSAFRMRVMKKFREASFNRKPISNTEAEQQVWREIEEELIEISETFENDDDYEDDGSDEG